MAVPAPEFRIVYAPERVELDGKGKGKGKSKSIFLAGSIDMGQAVDWQTAMADSFSHLPVTILNPRRPDWDSSWREDISFGPFREQVEWELDMLEAADVIALYFSPGSTAPISLLELGLFARSGKLFVACPRGYWKRGNVQIVCQRLGIELVDSVEELIHDVEVKLRQLGMDPTDRGAGKESS